MRGMTPEALAFGMVALRDAMPELNAIRAQVVAEGREMNAMFLNRHNSFLSRSTKAEIAPERADAAVEHFIREKPVRKHAGGLPRRSGPLHRVGRGAACNG